jgi:hypothetical protein
VTGEHPYRSGASTAARERANVARERANVARERANVAREHANIRLVRVAALTRSG